jgi:hypothetical protein
MPPINYTSSTASPDVIAFGGPPLIALDYDRPAVTDEFITNKQFFLLLLYGVVIPILLFLLSRLIRCLRQRGFISMSENSEECILDRCQHHLHQGIHSDARSMPKVHL